MFANVLKVRYLAVLALVLILAASAYAFAASNVVPETGAGDGDAAISGYTVENVSYTLGTPATKLASIAFDITPTDGALAPVTVKVQLEDQWFSCTVGTSPNWSCSLAGASPAVTVLAAENLQVVAAQ